MPVKTRKIGHSFIGEQEGIVVIVEKYCGRLS